MAPHVYTTQKDRALPEGRRNTEAASLPTQVEDPLLYGALGRSVYLGYWPPDRELGSSPEQLLAEKFPPSEERRSEREARSLFFGNFEQLVGLFAGYSGDSAVGELYGLVKTISPLAKAQIEASPPTGLGLHLHEITEFARSFFLIDGHKSRFPEILSDHKALLLVEVVAPVHDLLKYLGTPASMIPFDHEVVTAELLKRTCVGKRVVLANRVETLSQDDVAFIAAVVSDHENLYKEHGRSQWVRSENECERAKALFFVADTLTGAIVPKDPAGTAWRIDRDQLKARFVDLYFRHIDPVAGKTFRPEWARHAVADLSATLKVLTNSGIAIEGTDPGVSASQSLLCAALDGIDRALQADHERQQRATNGGASAADTRLTSAQTAAVLHVQGQLCGLLSEEQ